MKYALLGATFVALGLGAACAAEPLYNGEQDLIMTMNDPERSYAGYRTYRLDTTLAEFCVQPTNSQPSLDDSENTGGAGGSEPEEGSCQEVSHEFDAAVLKTLQEQMEASGFTKVDDDQEADVLLVAGWIAKDTWSLALPYCYPFSLEPGCVNPLNTSGLYLKRIAQAPLPPLLIEMFDESESQGEALVTVWTASIDRQDAALASEIGLGGATFESLERLVKSGITAAFDQSPYIRDRAGQ